MRKILLLIFFFLLSATPALAAVVSNTQTTNLNFLTNGLTGYWTFDGQHISGTTVQDKNPTATKNNGAMTGYTTTSGKIGQASKQNGTSSYTNVGTNTALEITGTEAFSISLWLKPDTAGQNAGLFGRYNAGSAGQYYLSLSGGKPFIFREHAPFVGLTGNKAPPPGVYSHVVATYDGASLRLYINGRLDASMAETVAINATSFSIKVFIGASQSGGNPTSYFYGALDDVRFYNRALSANEVSLLYRGPNRAVLSAQAVANKGATNGLVGHWTFDGGDMTATTALDKSVSANTLSLAGSMAKGAGKIGQGLIFDGVSNNASTMSTLDLSGVKTTTIAAWVKPVKTGAPGTAVLVQSNNSTTPTIAYSSAVTKGNLLVVVASCSATSDLITISDNQAHSWSKAVSGRNDDHSNIGIFYATAKANVTPTVTLSGCNFAGSESGAVFEYSGLSRILDGTTINTSSASSPTASTLTTTVKDVVIAGFAQNTSGGQTISSCGGGFSLRKTFGGTLDGVCDAQNVAAGSYAASLSGSGSSSWIVAQVAFKVAAAYTLVELGTDQSLVNDSFMLIASSSEKFACTSHGDVGNTAWESATTITIGKWYHVACTIDRNLNSSQVKLYVNGVLDGVRQSADSANTANFGNKTLYTGARAGNVMFANAVIDDVRIYSRALSANEVYSLYKYGSAKVTANAQAVANQGGVSGLVGHWTFNGGDTISGSTKTFMDRGSFGVIATSSTVQISSGKVGQGITCNGVTDMPQTNPNDSYNLQGGSHSFSAWVKTKTTAFSALAVVRGQLASNTNMESALYIDANGNIRYDTWDWSAHKITGSTIVRDNKWHFVTGVYDSGTREARLYVDGKIDAAPIGIVGSPDNVIKRVRMCSNSNVDAILQPLAGQLDDVRLYSRALSADEVYSLYKYGK